jgi:hypothetical protein
VNLTTDQWLISLGMSLIVLVFVEVKKLLKIQTDVPPVRVATEVAPVAA